VAVVTKDANFEFGSDAARAASLRTLAQEYV
jgi:hypothetical protein